MRSLLHFQLAIDVVTDKPPTDTENRLLLEVFKASLEIVGRKREVPVELDNEFSIRRAQDFVAVVEGVNDTSTGFTKAPV